MSNHGSDPYRSSRNNRSPGTPKQRSERNDRSRSPYGNSIGQTYPDDPYAPHQQYAHSTMSSSHQHSGAPKRQHRRPNDPSYQSQKASSTTASSMYQDGDPLPSYAAPQQRNEEGMGFLPHDNIVMDMDDSIPLHTKEATKSSDTPLDVRKRRRCCYRIGCKNLVALAFAFIALVVLVWYFVWPRAFETDLSTVGLYGNSTNQFTTTDNQITRFQTQWNVSMVADNKDNWVPTQVASLELAIYDHDTGIKIANASTGSFVLNAKALKPITFVASIDYLRATNAPTMDDLIKACAPQTDQKTQASLNLLFQVTYHISGFIWSYQTQSTSAYFLCPQ